MVSVCDVMDHFCMQVDWFIGYVAIWYEQQRFFSGDWNGRIFMNDEFETD